MEVEYLYGASVQGIQNFIFKTNKLTEIIGASEMVELICKEKHKEIINVLEKHVIIHAAGNIKFLLSKPDCEKIVREFPKKVMEYAPGITISQAVVKIEKNMNLSDAIDDLEKKLRTQRNKMPMPFEVVYMGMERYRQTGGGVIEFEDGKAICEATKIKRETARDNYRLLEEIVDNQFIDKNQATKQIEDLSIGTNSYIAVVHVDGNGLGDLLQKMGQQLKKEEVSFEDTRKAFKNFSDSLDKKTKQAAREAFKEVSHLKQGEKLWNKLPIRPIVLGGDDLTVLIQADMALPFVQTFLKKFEEYTKTLLEGVDVNRGLTACAGIAYVKDKYPLHYAMNLAEQLCTEAKTDSNRTKSAISFYKVQESFVEKLSDMRDRVKINENTGHKTYLLEEVETLNTAIKALSKDTDDVKAVVSKLRQWISELAKDEKAAEFMLDRIKTVNKDFYKALGTDSEQLIYDAIQIKSLSK